MPFSLTFWPVKRSKGPASSKGTPMELTQNRTVKIIAVLLLLAAITQTIYTGLYVAELQNPDFAINRKPLWMLEGMIFVLMAAFGGSALVRAKHYTLGFSAIAFSTALNVIQVGIGLVQFGPAGEALTNNPEILGGFANSIIALSFFGYNAAKILLAMAAVDFGIAKFKSSGKILGAVTILFGSVAFFTNSIVMMIGRHAQLSPIAGATGVIATVLLAFCLFGLRSEDETT